MNYLRVYCNLIRKAENRTPPDGYIEKHHIFPVSIFGNNNRIVVLSAREHYIAHALLEKIYIKRCGTNDKKTIKMTYAFWLMNNRKDNYCNSKLYEGARIRFYENNIWKDRKHSEETKEKLRQIGLNRSEEYKRNMSEIKKGKPMSEETKQKLRDANKGQTPWNKGKTNHLSEEQRKKISDTLKGRILSDETKAKMSIAKRQMSDETKAKMSIAKRKGRAGTTPHAY
jgi:hypothetical protein